MQYFESDRKISINPGISIQGISCRLDYIVDSINRGKSLLISRKVGAASESDIERIINTYQIKDVKPVLVD